MRHQDQQIDKLRAENERLDKLSQQINGYKNSFDSARIMALTQIESEKSLHVKKLDFQKQKLDSKYENDKDKIVIQFTELIERKDIELTK